MTREDALGLIVLAREDEGVGRAFRRLLVDLLQEEIRPILAPTRAERNVVNEPPPGMISYQRAMELTGRSNQGVRELVSKALVQGGNGLIDKQSLITYILANSRKATRDHLVRQLELEDEAQHQSAAAKTPAAQESGMPQNDLFTLPTA